MNAQFLCKNIDMFSLNDRLGRRQALKRLGNFAFGGLAAVASHRVQARASPFGHLHPNNVIRSAQAKHNISRPNIILILADDLGYGDLGCYGQKRVRTPYLDAMAAEGMRFTDFYAGATVCVPSRCSLLTGLHTGHTRIRANESVTLQPGDYTIAELLRENGYTTAAIGKWQLGGPESLGTPWLSGFAYFFGQLVGTQEYYPYKVWQNNRAISLPGNQGGQRQVYAPHLYTARALTFIRRNAHHPFFLYLAYQLPHSNNQLYHQTGNGMDVPSDAPYTDRPWPQVERNFAAMVSRLDRYVGRILEAIEAEGIARNTLVLFSSDNGPHSEGGHSADFFDSNGPLRGTKRSLYEGGIRVPMIAYWPGTIPAGIVSNQVWAAWDLMATIANLVGIAPPETTDGVSVLPVLLGQPPFERRPLYWENHETGEGIAQAVRWGSWKGVRQSPSATVELYDLSDDVGEKRNLASLHPALVAEIETIMNESRSGVSPRLSWSKRPGYETDGVHPDTGIANETAFRYEVRVADLDGKYPDWVRLTVLRDGERWFTTDLTPGRSVNRRGRTYYHVRRLPPANYQYQFSARDSDGATTLPVLGFQVGPIVPAPPYLTWTGEKGYSKGGVSPTRGEATTTLFEFRVLYRAHDGDLPDYVKLRLWRNGAPYRICTMKPSPRTTDPVTGIIYYIKRYLPQGEYQYQFLAADQHGRARGVASLRTGGLTVSGAVPFLSGLAAAPTPAGGAHIVFTLRASAHVRIEVANIAGRPVATPLAGRRLPAGAQTVIWSGLNARGVPVPSGPYLIRVIAKDPTGRQAQLLTNCTVQR